MRRLADLRALNAARHEAALEAGQKAAFGAAAVVAAVAMGSTAFERFGPQTPEMEPLRTPDADAVRLDFADALLAVDEPEIEAGTPHVGGPLEAVEPESFTIADDLPIVTAPERTVESATPDGVGAAFIDDAMRLQHHEPYASDDEPAQTAQAPEPSTLEALANDLGREYQAADASVRDVSLFVAADDEALSWSLTQASPNYGVVAYEDERVDVGNLAVGVALNLENARIAAAYVERDVDTRLNARFGEADRKQNFIGAIVTLKM